jgi:hypothetical protein
MQTSSPIDSNVAFAPIQARRTLHAAASADPAKFEEAVKYRAVVAHVVLYLFPRVVLHVVGRHFLEEIDVFVGVELCHFELVRWFCALH